MKQYYYKVRRQTKFLDNSSAFKRATFTTTEEPLNVGGLYILRINGKPGYYRIEDLVNEIDLDDEESIA